MQLFKFLAPDFLDQGVRAFPADNHSRVDVSRSSLDRASCVLRFIQQSIELMTHLLVERMLRVLLLVDVVLELLLAFALVLNVVANVERVKACFFHFLDVLDVLLVKELVTSF